jgi:hypothetical protein
MSDASPESRLRTRCRAPLDDSRSTLAWSAGSSHAQFDTELVTGPAASVRGRDGPAAGEPDHATARTLRSVRIRKPGAGDRALS